MIKTLNNTFLLLVAAFWLLACNNNEANNKPDKKGKGLYFRFTCPK